VNRESGMKVKSYKELNVWKKGIEIVEEAQKERIPKHKLQKTSVENLAKLLMKFIVVDSEETNQMILNKLPPDADRDFIEMEIMFLRTFVVDYTAYKILDNIAEKNAILDAFYSLFKDTTTDDSDIYKALKVHLLVYTDAIKKEHHMGTPYVVGKTFAKLCGYENDADVIFIGSLEFTSTFEVALENMKMIKKDLSRF